MTTKTMSKMFALALCIANIFCFSQQSTTGICNLGDIKNDSIIRTIVSLHINCSSNEITTFGNRAKEFISLKCIYLEGDTDADEWSTLFKQIKIKPSVNEIVFTGNTFETLPAGYENLYNIENITVCNNDGMNYFETFKQFKDLPNLRELTLDVYTIYDLPDNVGELKNLLKINLINKDEYISSADTSSNFEIKKPITYDFYVDKGNNNFAMLKYTASAGEIDSDEYLELKKRFKPTNLLFANTNSNFSREENYTPTYNNVKPPIKGIDVEHRRFIINPQIENVLVYPSGTKILVPANAFVDKDGKPLDGSVTINYREFRDPVDILVSGIPMKYDSAGVVNNFESAGMFELTASIKNEPVLLAPNKKIDMNFKTTSVDSTYNFYVYNDSSGNWSYINKPAIATNSTLINLKIYSDAFRIYRNLLLSKPRVPDTTTFANRFWSTEYVHTTRVDTNYIEQRKKYFKKRMPWFERYYSNVKVCGVRKLKDGKVLFKVKSNFESNPELNAYTNLYFVCTDNITANQFKKKYVHQLGYNDVRIRTNGDDVEIILKDYKTFKAINAEVATIDYKGKPQNVRYVNKVNKVYNKRLAYRERVFNKSVRKGRNWRDGFIELTDSNAVKKYAYAKAEKQMSDVEKKMTYAEWLTYYEQVTANEKGILNNSAASAGNLIESLQLDGMGIYNCDQIMRIKEPVNVMASYRKDSLKVNKPQTTYIIDKKINGVLSYNSYKGQPNDIAFSKSENAENILIEVDDFGKVGIYKTDEFKKQAFYDKEHFEFNLEKVNTDFTTVGDLKKIIGL